MDMEAMLRELGIIRCELKVKTLEGRVLTVEVMPTNSIRELKAMLREKKHCEDPIERQILQVKVLANGGLLLDDDQTLESAGLLHAESEVTAIFCRNEVEAATKEAIHAEGPLQVNIPSSLTEIHAEAFEDHHQVVTVAIPESVTVIGDAAFRNCEYLASISIPQSVTAIGDFAFADCKSLETITIPQSVTAIGRGAFKDCNSLASITIAESVTSIGSCAFAGCDSLASITIPASVTDIGYGAFLRCFSLASITIPASVTSIGSYAFLRCFSLASITIPESVTDIGYGAFAHCTSLESITIPESLRDDGRQAFDDEVQARIRHVWRVFVCCNCWMVVFKFESASMGQCGLSDQFSIISNSPKNRKIPKWEIRSPKSPSYPNRMILGNKNRENILSPQTRKNRDGKSEARL